MRYKSIEGYKYPYRVSDEGDVERQWPNGKWKKLKPYEFFAVEQHTAAGIAIPNHREFCAGLVHQLHGAPVADAFLGGTPPGALRVHKNGMQQDNAVENIIFLTRSASPSEPPAPARRRMVPMVKAQAFCFIGSVGFVEGAFCGVGMNVATVIAPACGFVPQCQSYDIA